MSSPTTPRLLCYTIQGSQSRFLPCDQPNKEYLSQVYVCATTLREMSSLIKRHLPCEEISVVEISQADKQWPPNMRWIKPESGVWGCKRANGPIVFRFENGQATEID